MLKTVLDAVKCYCRSTETFMPHFCQWLVKNFTCDTADTETVLILLVSL